VKTETGRTGVCAVVPATKCSTNFAGCPERIRRLLTPSWTTHFCIIQDSPDLFYGPNFQFQAVPEPGAVGLLIPGMVFLTLKQKLHRPKNLGGGA
jgi:hypothetical protein